MATPIVVLAPDGRDAEVIDLVLGEAGLSTRICPDLDCVCAALGADAAGLLVAEGALSAGLDGLLGWLRAQPPWSDLPVLILTARGTREASQVRRDLFRQLGNVTLLDRPLHAEALQSAARAALRARERQYRTRAHLTEIAEAATLLERRVEERTRDLHREMEQRQRAEESLRQAQKMEAVGQLTGGIAHDFNNLLQAIGGSLDLIRRRLESGRTDVEPFARAARQSVDRAAALTQRMLAFARRQPLQPRAVDLNAVVLGMEDLLLHSVGSGVRIDLRLSNELWPCWADANQIENALLNLVINARDAMPGGGVLTVSTANTTVDEVGAVAAGGQAGPYVELTVTDTGDGMTPEVLERAFEPFFTTKPAGQGTGLGLSQLHGFAHQSGGMVRIVSAPACGTAVTLRLPPYEGPIPADPPVEDTAEIATAAATILLVEDEALVRLVMGEALRAHGYAVLEAGDGAAALALLDSGHAVDLLISDVGLPGLNGREVAERARQLRPDLAVLFVTGYTHETGIEEDLGLGTGMLSKPVTLDRLLVAVAAMLKAGGIAQRRG